MRHEATTQARNSLLYLSAFITVITFVSLYANLHKVDTQYRQLAAVVGRSFFQAVSAMRDWNMRHGGVYIPVTKDSRPNPLLQDPLREVMTQGGTRLTKVNHAQMLRVISNLLKEERGVRMRISGLTPLHAANAPDGWERNALGDLEKGQKETYEVVGTGDQAVFRFMSPLKVDPSCVGCHKDQKERVGNIYGGVSVTFAWAPFEKLMSRNNRQIWITHLLFLGVSFLLIFLLGRKLVVQIDALQESLQRIRTLEGLVPICANCKKIRAEGGNPFEQSSWTSVERYISDRTDAEFTHGLCPECAKILYPGVESGEEK